MSGVSATGENSYQVYKSISELEKELRDEAKRSRIRQEQEINELNEAHSKDLQKQEEEFGEATKNQREGMNEAFARDREVNRHDANRKQSGTYDRYGKVIQKMSEDHNKLSDVTKETLSQMQDNQKEQVKKLDEYYQDRNQKLFENNRETIEKAIRNGNESQAEMAALYKEADKEEYQSSRKNLETSNQLMSRKLTDETAFQTEKAAKGIEDARRDYNDRVELAEKNYDKRHEDRELMYNEMMRDNARKLGDSRDNETGQYRRQLSEIANRDRLTQKDANSTQENLIKNFNSDMKAQQRVMDNSYKDQIRGLKGQLANQDQDFAYIQSESLRDKDLFFTSLLAEKSNRFQNDLNDANHTYVRNLQGIKDSNEKQNKFLEEATTNRLREIQEKGDMALEKQAESQRKMLSNAQKSAQSEQRQLEAELNRQKTSESPDVVSPQAEQRIVDAVTVNYEKKLTNLDDTHKKKHDLLKNRLAGDFQQEIARKDNEMMLSTQRYATDRIVDRAEFTDRVSSAETGKFLALRNLSEQQADERQQADRKMAQSLEEQRRHYEEMMETAKTDSKTQIVNQRQESDFKFQMSQRENATKTTLLIRDYERKMNLMKDDHDTKLSDVKSQLEQTLRETEKKGKKDIDELSRTYEQRLAQMKVQQEEREHLLTQNYTEELDKLRRSNELLSQRRSSLA